MFQKNIFMLNKSIEENKCFGECWKYEGCGTYADDNRRNTAETSKL